MHLAVVLIGLAVFGAAIPLPHDMTDGEAMDMAHDTAQPKVETYAEYGAYYTDYGNYASKDAKTDQSLAKRTKLATYTPYSNYGCYPGASAEEVANMKKRGYSCYDSYGAYSEAVDKEGSKMDKMDMDKMDKMMARRHMMITHEEMMMKGDGDADNAMMMTENGDQDNSMMMEGDSNDSGTMMQKRDIPLATDTEERKAPHESLPDNDNKYQIYDPYTEYGHYSAAGGGGEGVEMQ
ncbi:hypothetical protein CFE70_007644 [Pyrenophora teres f. teres 0-1]|uniref:Uncharacterized protein n=1 Tax=Pyrenophora teres f. teres (strain 0-1) TaxID=861557 RepID=E3RRD2_PYRTT|nr:hypothetical protein PTT_11355 [Pyrenophora teres f. teres 0-1]KAE8825376.1 hypothetical protein HRS9139_08486 [Pyrenophora teres f. teres]